MKNADLNRFFSYFVDYVIKNDQKVKVFREQNKLSIKKPTIDLSKKAQQYVGENFQDYMFLNDYSARQILETYLFRGARGAFELVEHRRNIGIYQVKDDWLEVEIRNLQQSEDEKQHWYNIDTKTAELYPVSIKLSPDATISSFRKFITQNWDFIEDLLHKRQKATRTNYGSIKSRSLGTNVARLLLLENDDMQGKALQRIIFEETKRKISLEQIRNLQAEIRKHKDK